MTFWENVRGWFIFFLIIIVFTFGIFPKMIYAKMTGRCYGRKSGRIYKTEDKFKDPWNSI